MTAILTVKEAASLLKTSRQQVRKMIQSETFQQSKLAGSGASGQTL